MERTIRCSHCRGDGTNHAPGYDRPGASPVCPICGGSGVSRSNFDQERNASTCGVKGLYDTLKELEAAMAEQFAHLMDVQCATKGQYDFRTGNTVGVLTSWKNPDFEERYARDQRDELYPKGYWANVEGSKPY